LEAFSAGGEKLSFECSPTGENSSKPRLSVGREWLSFVAAHVLCLDNSAPVHDNVRMAKGKNIASNLTLRVKGWRAACRSPKVPEWLKPGLRKAIRRAEKRLRRQRQRGRI
jgi:hypothetical protein